MGNSYHSPSLIFSWANSEYHFGNDPDGSELLTTDNVFTVVFRIGQSSNFLDAETAKKSGQKTEREIQRLRESNPDQDFLPQPSQVPLPKRSL